VPLAPQQAFVVAGAEAARPSGRSGAAATADAVAERTRLGLPDRYLVYFGRFDARHDVGALLRALAALGGSLRPRGLPAGSRWPPTILIAGASPEDRASLARAAVRLHAGDSLVFAPPVPPGRLAALVRDARAVVMPALTDAAGLAALDAVAAGVPVVATAVGALPEAVGKAGILVEPRDPARLAEALRTMWADDRVRDRLVHAAMERSGAAARTWAAVAAETRRVYADVGVRARDGSPR
jgi:D-inositol-3-phosphate glycosyltransferase